MWDWLVSLAASETPKLGLRWAARKLLQLWWVRMLRGIRIYSNRTALNKKQSLLDIVKSVETVEACFVTGATIFASEEMRAKVRRLLLPDPESDAFTQYCAMFQDNSSAKNILNTKDKALRANTPVKWTKSPLFNSFLIGDRDKHNAFVQIEFALPGLEQDKRPIMTIKKSTHPEEFRAFVNAFDKIWDHYSHDATARDGSR